MLDNRSKYFVFVPFCLLAQAYQAQGIVKYEWKSSIKSFVNLLFDNDINIVQMPCAESTYHNDLIREPMGITKYNTKDFNNHWEQIAENVSDQIRKIIKSNYKVIAILGIEHSPSCCVNYIYTSHENENRRGLFMEKLYDKIKEYDIPFIGINRKYINKSLKQLEKIINETKNTVN